MMKSPRLIMAPVAAACLCRKGQRDRAQPLIVRLTMKFIHLFLVGYFVLIVGVVLALWQTGVLSRVSPIWSAIGVILAAGMGIMMSVSAGKPTMVKDG
jgi:hypothetical protein